jgi:hypothetical protein
MKNFLIAILYTAVFAIMSSCGGNKKPSVLDTMGAAKDYSSNVSKEQKVTEDKWAARKAKGDTMAMPYVDLQAYLPDITGYTKNGGPKGSQMNMPGMGSLSTAEQEYANGDKKITVSIVDYNSAYQAFVGATAVFKMGLSMEDDDKKQGPVDLGVKDVVAYETTYKKNQQGDLALIAGDRFLIEIRSQGSNDAQLLTSTASGMKLGDLASK